ncbi:MAG: sulfite exporter TauE/SafE family protein [Burkholderiales bacterium]|nr:sulfite exporter TauE/SafE family protein [Burkholderiales bacterium]
MIISEPWFYAVAIPVVLLQGIAKGGFAGTLSGVSVPLLALAISPVQAAAIMLPILVAMDLFGLTQFWRSFDRRVLASMLPGAVIGTALGYATARLLDDNWVRVFVGLIAIGFPLSRLFMPATAAVPRPPGTLRGSFWTAIGGVTSFIAHAGSPPVMVYLLPQRLDRRTVTATVAVLFAAMNFMKLPGYALLGQLNLTNMGSALVLLPLAPLGVWLGMRLQRRINDAQFYVIGQAFLVITGIKLLWDGARGLGAF